MKKGTIALMLFALMLAFAAIIWFRIYEGGHAFTTTPAQLNMWAASHIALMILTAVCIVGAVAADSRTSKTLFWSTVAFLAVVQLAGQYVGLGNAAESANAGRGALLQKAAAFERQAADIRATVQPQVDGLAISAEERGGVAARNKLDYLRDEIKRAGDLDAAAADLRARAGVTTGGAGDRLAEILLILMTVATELGFAICSKLLAVMFGAEIRNVFNGIEKRQAPPPPGK